MLELRDEFSTDDQSNVTKKIVPVPKNLADYQGTKLAQPASPENPGFSMSLGGRIAYQNLAEKGGMLRLLHEIAHAWQMKYHEGIGRLEFEEFYRDVSEHLSMMERLQRRLKENPELLPQPEAMGDEVPLSPADFMLNRSRDELRKFGIEIDPASYHYAGQQLGGGTYKISVPHVTRVDGILRWEKLEFVVTSERIKHLIERFAWEERKAWADAIRVLRHLRENGFDLEPELKSYDDIQEIVHYALGTYQASIEAKLEPTKDIKQFTRKSRFEIDDINPS